MVAGWELPQRSLHQDAADRDRGSAGAADRAGSFDPQIVPKHARRLAGFNDQIISLYARGMTMRDIRSHIEQLDGVEVSPDLISKVTDAVKEEITLWQNRPLESVWPIVYIDALWVKVRDGRL